MSNEFAFQKFMNEVINGIRITGIARREPNGFPVWSGVCTRCNCSGMVYTHNKVKAGDVQCQNKSCGKAVEASTRGTAIGANVGIRTASSRERDAFEKEVVSDVARPQPTRLGEMMSLRGNGSERGPFNR